MKQTLLLLFMAMITLTAAAQQYRVVTDETDEAVDEVVIISPASNFSTTTNAEGYFTVSGLAPTDTLYFQHPAYYDYNVTLEKLTAQRGVVRLPIRAIFLQEFTVAASKRKEKIENVSTKIDIIRSKQIAFENSPTTAHMLESTGNVFVQRSQMGGGSPIIRGFEANKVLLVVDGVRMNNAIYRSGHLQNAITIDAAIIDRTEVVYGPGSLIYGSDALGGVMHFYTKNPELSLDEKLNVFGSGYLRFASANSEKSGHIDLNIGSKRIGFLTSLTLTDFDDLRVGARQNPFYDDFGQRPEYVQTSDANIDSIVANDDPQILRFTGYQQIDLLQKVLIKASDKLDVTLNFQYSNTSNIPRYDKLTETTGLTITEPVSIQVFEDTIITIDTTYEVDQLRHAQWDYGPQKRIFGSVKFDFAAGGKAFDDGSLVVGYQRISEQRISRDYQSSSRRTRDESLHVLTTNLDLAKQLKRNNTLQYGLEFTYNDVQSTAFSQDINTLEIGEASTRYPEGGSNMHTYAGYLKYTVNVSDKVIITPGVRFSQILLNSKFIDTDFFNFDFSEININTSAFSGMFSVVFNPNKDWNIRLVGSSGYRSPNVDDVGKVFDPQPGIVVVPNKNLKPEYAYNTEFGVTRRFGDKVKLGALVFNTLISNAIQRDDFNLNGQTSVEYDGTLSRVQANINIGRATIRGVTINFQAELSQYFSFRSDFNYVNGQDQTNDVPLSHIPPLYGQTSLLTKYKKFRLELNLRYNGWKRLEDYSPSGVDNLNEATAEGTPAWYTVNLRSSLQFNRYFRMQFAAENIFDQHYRPFGSGVSAPGRNFIVSAYFNFGG